MCFSCFRNKNFLCYKSENQLDLWVECYGGINIRMCPLCLKQLMMKYPINENKYSQKQNWKILIIIISLKRDILKIPVCKQCYNSVPNPVQLDYIKNTYSYFDKHIISQI